MKDPRISLVLTFLALIVLCSGCTGAGFAKGLKELGADNALIRFDYSGVYGPIKFTRVNPKPGQTATIQPDGSITVGWATNAPAPPNPPLTNAAAIK
jgi:hypothetical protein